MSTTVWHSALRSSHRRRQGLAGHVPLRFGPVERQHRGRRGRRKRFEAPRRRCFLGKSLLGLSGKDGQNHLDSKIWRENPLQNRTSYCCCLCLVRVGTFFEPCLLSGIVGMSTMGGYVQLPIHHWVSQKLGNPYLHPTTKLNHLQPPFPQKAARQFSGTLSPFLFGGFPLTRARINQANQKWFQLCFRHFSRQHGAAVGRFFNTIGRMGSCKGPVSSYAKKRAQKGAS